MITDLDIFWHELSPYIFDTSMSFIEKLSAMHDKVNEIILSQNNLGSQWVTLQSWINTQLEAYATTHLDIWKNDGTLNAIINQAIFGDLNTKVTTNTTDIAALKKRVIHLKDYVTPDGNADNTAKIQQAINESVNSILWVDGSVYPYRSSQIVIPSNSYLIFDSTFILKAIDTWVTPALWQAPLLDIRQAKNVKIFGNGATITQNKITPSITEHAHCLGFRGCENVYVENLKCTNANGDGFYIDQYDGDTNNVQPKNVTIKNCFADNNGRLGVSIMGGTNIILEDCEFNNSKGTAPQSGMDIEPELRNTALQLIVKNCKFSGNSYANVLLSLGKLSCDANIEFENCHTYSGNCGYMVNNVYTGHSGKIEFLNCVSETAGASSFIDMSGKYDTSITRRFVNCKAINGNQRAISATDGNTGENGYGTDFYVCSDTAGMNKNGNVEFINCVSQSDGKVWHGYAISSQTVGSAVNNVKFINCLASGYQNTSYYGRCYGGSAYIVIRGETLERYNLGDTQVACDGAYNLITTNDNVSKHIYLNEINTDGNKLFAMVTKSYTLTVTNNLDVGGATKTYQSNTLGSVIEFTYRISKWILTSMTGSWTIS